MKPSNVEELKRSLLEDPTKSEKYLKLGYAYHRKADYYAALRTYEKGLKIKNNCSKILCKKGLTYHNLGEHENAINAYKSAVDNDYNNLEAIYYLGFIANQKNQYNNAIGYLEKLLGHEGMGHAYYQFGIAMEKIGRRDEAIKRTVQYIIENIKKPEFEALISYGYLQNGIRDRKRSGEINHIEYLTNKVMKKMGVEKLHCFGDSHRSLFNNIDGIVCHNVGSATAYNLCNQSSTTNAGKNIGKILKDLRPEENGIILVFGEVDCMEHIAKNVLRTKKGVEQVVKEVAKRYTIYVKNLLDHGYKVIVIGINISGYAKNSYGSMIERGKISGELNSRIKKRLSEEKNAYYADISHITNTSNKTTDLELTSDGRHLDNFPEGSEIIQALIMSEIIKDQDSKEMIDVEIKDEKNVSKEQALCVMSEDCTEKNRGKGRKIKMNRQNGLSIRNDWKSGNNLTIFFDLMDHHVIERIEIKGNDLGGKIKVKEYVNIKSNGNEQKGGHIDIKDDMIIIKPEEDITRVVCIKLEDNKSKSQEKGITLEIDEIRIKKRKI